MDLLNDPKNKVKESKTLKHLFTVKEDKPFFLEELLNSDDKHYVFISIDKLKTYLIRRKIHSLSIFQSN